MPTLARPSSPTAKKTTKITSWSIRGDVVRKLDRIEQELETPPSDPTAESAQAPF